MIPAWNPAGGKRKQPEGSRAIRLHQRKCCSGCFPFYMSETNPIRTRILTASKDIDCNECQVVCAALANHLAPNGVELWGGFGQAEELGIQVSAFQWPTGVVLENSNLVVDQIFVQNDLLIRRELKVSSVNTSNPRLQWISNSWMIATWRARRMLKSSWMPTTDCSSVRPWSWGIRRLLICRRTWDLRGFYAKFKSLTFFVAYIPTVLLGCT